MLFPPRIFISAVSKELEKERSIAIRELIALGYTPICMETWELPAGEMYAKLREEINSCRAVLQLVGRRYGLEGNEPPAPFERCSFTQYEARYARQRRKKVWYLYFEDACCPAVAEAETDELRELQIRYRQEVLKGLDYRHRIKEPADFLIALRGMRRDLVVLRRRARIWLASVLIGITLILGFVGRLVRDNFDLRQRLTEVARQQHAATEAAQDAREEIVAGRAENAKFHNAMMAYAGARAGVEQSQPGQTREVIEQRTYEELARMTDIKASDLREKLPALAKEMRRSQDTAVYDRANAAYVDQDYPEAERLALDAAHLALRARPRRHLDALDAYMLAGWSAEAALRQDAALAHYDAAEELAHLEGEPVAWAQAAQAIANLLHDRGRAREAEKLYRAAIDIFSARQGAEDLNTLSCRHQLAGTLEAQGKLAEAEKELRDVLAIRFQVTGTENPDTLSSRHNLAGILLDRGKLAEAEKEYREILSIRIRRLGADNPDTLTTRHNLACLLMNKGQFAKAEEELRSVSQDRERVQGLKHPLTLLSRSMLAVALREQNKLVEADKILQTCLGAQVELLPPGHKDILATANKLATVHRLQGQFQVAEGEYRMILQVGKRSLGADHHEVLNVCLGLALTLQSQGKFQAAHEFAKRAESGLAATLQTSHPDRENAQSIRKSIEADLKKESRKKVAP
jgi:hypothetical protein